HYTDHEGLRCTNLSMVFSIALATFFVDLALQRTAVAMVDTITLLQGNLVEELMIKGIQKGARINGVVI
ncbi:hypothetical protein CU098_008184, partial [Rhizopus stolonifer]